jgi:8-oxo-dGTP pyrophosphatase MutT (NUDIX family)
MQTKDDISYGVIPLFQKDDGTWNVFLIHQYGHAGDIYWTFPKGHPEASETGEEAARRELLEETGITLASLDTSKPYTQTYNFPYKGVLINKTVVYYVGIASSLAYAIQEDEVQNAGWYSFEAALPRLTHDRAREMLTEVALHLGVVA